MGTGHLHAGRSELARKAMSEHLAAGAAPLINHLVEHGMVEPGDGSTRPARGYALRKKDDAFVAVERLCPRGGDVA
jgi:hypothetical protein